jgi:hypothetical protein
MTLDCHRNLLALSSTGAIFVVAGWLRGCRPMPSEQQQAYAKYQHDQSPPQIDIETKRMAFIYGTAAGRQAIGADKSTQYREHHADRQSDIESHIPLLRP